MEWRPVPKNTRSRRIKPTQRQMGEIKPKVRKEVKDRSQGVCEVRVKCTGDYGRELAHITGRKQLNHVTTSADLLDSCIACHRWLDQTPEGIRYKRQLRSEEE